MELVSGYSVASLVKSNTELVDQSVKWSERNLFNKINIHLVDPMRITGIASSTGPFPAENGPGDEAT